jgi:hypothetical protein
MRERDDDNDPAENIEVAAPPAASSGSIGAPRGVEPSARRARSRPGASNRPKNTELVTATPLARQLGVSPTYVRQLADKGKIPFEVVDGVRCFRPELAVQALVEKRTTVSTTHVVQALVGRARQSEEVAAREASLDAELFAAFTRGVSSIQAVIEFGHRSVRRERVEATHAAWRRMARADREVAAQNPRRTQPARAPVSSPKPASKRDPRDEIGSDAWHLDWWQTDVDDDGVILIRNDARLDFLAEKLSITEDEAEAIVVEWRRENAYRKPRKRVAPDEQI